MSNLLSSLFSRVGYTQEQMIQGMVADGIASEQELRALLNRGNPAEIAQFMQQRTQTQQRSPGLMQQARELLGFR